MHKVVLTLIVLTTLSGFIYGFASGIKRPPDVDHPSKVFTASNGVILIRCAQCANLTIVSVPKGTKYTMRHVEPLQEEYIPGSAPPCPTPSPNEVTYD